MKTQKRKTGDLGEKIAEKWLNNKGFSILERNYLKKWGEIDIVAQNKGVLRFIEVKTVKRNLSSPSSRSDLGEETGYRPEENVHSKKLKRLHRAIQSYLMENSSPSPGLGEEWQLDVVAVYIDEEHKLAKVEMMENVL